MKSRRCHKLWFSLIPVVQFVTIRKCPFRHLSWLDEYKMNAKERYEKYKEKSMIAKERTNKLIFVFLLLLFLQECHIKCTFLFFVLFQGDKTCSLYDGAVR